MREALKVGNGLEEGVVVGPLIEPSAVNKVREHVDDAVAGAQPCWQAVSLIPWREFLDANRTGDCHEGMKLAEEETFGPVAACFRFTSEDEVIQRANNTPMVWRRTSIPRISRGSSAFHRPLKAG
jgi:succinate-semialdehyde dehydrogenase/glutarate-semialdehyde dehydrogenase